jgi:hypothetical protein
MMRAEKKIFNYIGIEKVFYKNKYRHTKVVRGCKYKNSSFMYTGEPLIPNINKLKMNDTFVEEQD